jgi:hypothetical protein
MGQLLSVFLEKPQYEVCLVQVEEQVGIRGAQWISIGMSNVC